MMWAGAAAAVLGVIAVGAIVVNAVGGSSGGTTAGHKTGPMVFQPGLFTDPNHYAPGALNGTRSVRH